jgi:predicted molibdopterin-dependent oxidoreductase YjgC
MQIMRYAEPRQHPFPVDQRHQPGGVPAGATPDPFDPVPAATVPGRARQFRTETTEFADVVLPAATWGEKTGTFTNADRTVHLSDKAIEPPGQARPGLDISLAYTRQMGFRHKDGAPLPPWHDTESAFEAWKQCSAGRPCDYTWITYAKLRCGSGIQWPCTTKHLAETERLYANGQFWSDRTTAKATARA